MPLVVLVKFCSQGDNIPDAVGLATYLNEWLGMVSERYTYHVLTSQIISKFKRKVTLISAKCLTPKCEFCFIQ